MTTATVEKKAAVTEAETQVAKTDAELLENIDRDRAIALATEAVEKFEKVSDDAETRKPKSKAKTGDAKKAPAKAKRATPQTPGEEKTFQICGVSNVKGTLKIRFANNTVAARTKILEKAEHTDIRLVDLGEGTRLELAQRMLAHEDFQDAEAQEVISREIERLS